MNIGQLAVRVSRIVGGGLVLIAGLGGAAAGTVEAPSLQTAFAVIVAGGGGADFKTTTLLDVLAGPLAGSEAAKLTQHFGAPAVKGVVTTLDFVVADVVRASRARVITFPAAPAPDPKDGTALANALYAAGGGKPGQSFDADRMLDHLISHQLRLKIMHDVVATYGIAADRTFLAALNLVVSDLQRRLPR